MVVVGCEFGLRHYIKQVPEWLCNQALKPSFQYVVKFKKWQTCFRIGRLDQQSWQNGLREIRVNPRGLSSSVCEMQFAATSIRCSGFCLRCQSVPCAAHKVTPVWPGHCTKAAENNKSFPAVYSCDLGEMASLRLAGMGSSQRKQKQGVSTALFSARELDWLLFSPVMAPRGLRFCWHSEQAAVGCVCLGFLQGDHSGCPDKGLAPAHTDDNLVSTTLPVHRANMCLHCG